MLETRLTLLSTIMSALRYILPLISGGMLFLSDHPVHAWPLQAVALLPWLFVLEKWVSRPRQALLAGLLVSLAFNLPLSLLLRFPPALAAGLGLYLSLILMLMSLGIWLALRAPGVTGALGAAAAALLVEMIDFSVLPMWGTAQSFVRVWTAAPWAVQFSALAGVPGVVFALVAAQALMLRLLLHSRGRARAAAGLLVLMAAVGTLDALLWSREPAAKLKVAAMGWTRAQLSERGARGPSTLLERVYRPFLEEAVAAGARVVVSPEVGFFLSPEVKPAVMRELSLLARKHGRWLAVGYFDQARDDNRIAFFDPTGKLRGEYAKTHLIPLMEDYRAGDGQLVILEAGGARLGGMICQDDNFTDLARAHGRRKAQLLAVPTNDWIYVKEYHLENSIYRALENRYGVVRAASNGISAIISPKGELLARRDHFSQGPGIITAEMPLEEGGAPYSITGDWPLVGLSLVLFGWAWRKGRSASKQ